MSKQLQEVVPKDVYPEIQKQTDYDFSFRDALVTSYKRKENLIRRLMDSGLAEILTSFIGREPESFTEHRLQAEVALKAVKELSVSLPTTSISEVKWSNETNNRKEMPEPISIPREELFKANQYMLEAQREEIEERSKKNEDRN